jgi:hypothetical protein
MKLYGVYEFIKRTSIVWRRNLEIRGYEFQKTFKTKKDVRE